MTFTLIPITQTYAKILPGLPLGPRMIDTAPLRMNIPHLIAQIYAAVRISGAQRGMLKRLREARRMFAQLYRAEKANFTAWLTGAMQADPVWQAQVREDLGGEAALQRWDARYERMLASLDAEPREPKTPQTLQTSGTARTNRPRAQTLTDRHGLFRLARLTTIPPTLHRFRGPRAPSPRKMTIDLRPLRPIALSPDQLRPSQSGANFSRIGFCDRGFDDRSFNNRDFGGGNFSRGNHARQTAKPRQNNLSLKPQPMTLDAIQSRWAEVHHQYTQVNSQIMDIALLISTPGSMIGVTPRAMTEAKPHAMARLAPP